MMQIAENAGIDGGIVVEKVSLVYAVPVAVISIAASWDHSLGTGTRDSFL